MEVKNNECVDGAPVAGMATPANTLGSGDIMPFISDVAVANPGFDNKKSKKKFKSLKDYIKGKYNKYNNENNITNNQ